MNDTNTFKNNYADNSGGGMKWDDTKPELDSSNIFNSNTAMVYGDHIASFA